MTMRTPSLRRSRVPHLLPPLLALCLLLSACSGFTQKVKRRFGGELTFDVQLDSQLNEDFPLAVDFVVVYDPDLYAKLGKMSASDWFGQRRQLQADHAPDRLEVRSWEWVPPECNSCPGPGPQTIDYRIGAKGGVLFANYFNPGTHRLVVEPLGAFTLALGRTEASKKPPPSRSELKAARKEAKRAHKAAKSKKGGGGP